MNRWGIGMVVGGFLAASTAAFTLFLPGCQPPPAPINGPDGDGETRTFTSDTTVDSLRVTDATTASVLNSAVVTVTGDTTIDGILIAEQGRLTLRVDGDLTVNGRLESRGAAPADDELDAPLEDQSAGIFIIVGSGAVTFGPDATVASNGPVIVTDDASALARTPAEFFDEVEDVSADDLATLVPLPPENDAFDETPKSAKWAAPLVYQGAAGAPVTVSGVWPPAGLVVPGDRPVIIFQFNGSRPLILDGWTVNGPPAPPGAGADGSGDPGSNATGRSGKNGLRLNIRNNGGPINITNDVVLNLANGGDGGSATAVCGGATGGDGGLSGNFRMTAAGGIDLTGGTLTINPGRGGNGGTATVDPGPAGADGCPGAAGTGGSARGGNGGANRKRLFARGNVTGLENLTVGTLSGGSGGEANAIVCDGGDGIACCNGGPGGSAEATGGAGGEASLNVSGLPVNVGDAVGGDGGAAAANGGNGGNGGDCKFGDGGDGGTGGAAAAAGGAGGAATNATGGAVGGDGGDATAIGGNGGSGGDSGFGTPGAGGAGGSGTGVSGAGGAAATAGEAGTADADDGPAGPPGGQMAVTLFCITPTDFLVPEPGQIPPGERQGPVVDPESGEEIGVIDIEFVAGEGTNYVSNNNPLPHVGLDNGTLAIKVGELRLDQGSPGTIGGLRIEPLFGNGLSEENPVRIEALDENGQVIDSRSLSELPNNFDNPETPESVDVLFESTDGLAEIHFVAPPNSFVTIIRVYLLDP